MRKFWQEPREVSNQYIEFTEVRTALLSRVLMMLLCVSQNAVVLFRVMKLWDSSQEEEEFQFTERIVSM